MVKGILAFILIFGVIVVVHEFGHFYFAKKAGILVREFAIGMGPKIFSHTDQDGTLYTIRILPLGGYVRMAGWGEDKTEIKAGSPALLSFNADGIVTRIDLSGKESDQAGLPMQVTSYDLEEALTITGLVLEETKTFSIDHDATIVEEDGTELRIAPLDVQYQNASVWGRFLTNFAGPMNNFILGFVAFLLLIILQGGVENLSSNAVTVVPNSAFARAGGQTGDKIVSLNDQTVTSYQDISSHMADIIEGARQAPTVEVVLERDGQMKTLQVETKEDNGAYYLGVSPILKTGLVDQVIGAFQRTVRTALMIVSALRNLIARFEIDKLGGPVAMYTISARAAEDGWISVLSLLAMLSINLGIFNLIPIPALDGGKIVINILEAIRRKPLKRETESYITLAGVVVMVLLMLVVTWNDIVRVFF